MASQGHTSRNCLAITGRLHNLTFVLLPCQFQVKLTSTPWNQFTKLVCLWLKRSRTSAPTLPLRAPKIVGVRYQFLHQQMRRRPTIRILLNKWQRQKEKRTNASRKRFLEVSRGI
jgi:hypothetical protein